MEKLPTNHRRSLRLKDYDYSSAGAYFVTICTFERKCLFGEIKHQELILNEVGRLVQTAWKDLAQRFHTIELDEFVVMPNHTHGIVVLVGAPLVGAQRNSKSSGVKEMDVMQISARSASKRKVGTRPTHERKVGTRPTPTLGDVIGAFKSITTGEYIRGVKNNGWPPFAGRFWQRNYYEHVIRSESSLARIREYIVNNPSQWEFDSENTLADSDRRKKGEAVEKQFWEELKANS